MKNITLTPILLPTSETSPLIIRRDGLLYQYDGNEFDIVKSAYGKNHHLYLTSSAPIKEGDWFYDKDKNLIRKAEFIGEREIKNTTKGAHFIMFCQKIEFTTDQKLIADGVPAIPQFAIYKTTASKYSSRPNTTTHINFLEEFCKRYNQKDNQKVDIKQLASDMASDESEYRGFIAGFEKCQSLQSSAGGFSLEDVRKIWDDAQSALKLGIHFKDYIKEFQSLPSSSSSPSGSLIIELIEGVLTFK